MGESDDEDKSQCSIQTPVDIAALKQIQTTAYAQLTRRSNVIAKLLSSPDVPWLSAELPLLVQAIDAAIDAHDAYAEAVMVDAILPPHEGVNFESRIGKARALIATMRETISTLARSSSSSSDTTPTPTETHNPTTEPSADTSSNAEGTDKTAGLPDPPSAPSSASQCMQPLDPSATPFQPDFHRLLEAISLPHPEIEKFDGDVIKYRQFIAAFDARITARTLDNRDRLYYLNQHLSGEPKDLINSCFFMAPNEGYQQARQLLDSEYGDPYRAAMTFLSKIHAWPVVESDDNVALREFYFFLVKCQCARNSLSDMDVLNHPNSMQTIVSKLPLYLQNKWRDNVFKIKSHQLRSPHFDDLLTFVSAASSTANDPVFGKAALSFTNSPFPATGKTKATSGAFKPGACFHAGVSDAVVCPLCKKDHDLESCNDFIAKSVSERRDFVMSNRLCFGCFETGHVTRFCKSRRTCRECKKQHPTLLHDPEGVRNRAAQRVQDQRDTRPRRPPPTEDNHHLSSAAPPKAPTEASNSSFSTETGSSVLHAVIPVKVFQKGKAQAIRTYAFYDNGSSACFISESLIGQLQADASDIHLNLRTMHGESLVQCHVVRDLVVSDLEGNNGVEIRKLYSRDEIPLSVNSIPCKDNVSKWPHLSDIPLPPLFPQMEIGLLIGSNCPRALEPLDVAPGRTDEPYAVRLRHGWAVHGPYTLSDGTVSAHRVSTCELSAIEKPTPHSMMHVLEREFLEEESSPDQKGQSQDDLKFLEVVESGVQFHDGHYEIPLPLRNPNTILPDNRSMALRRAFLQKAKMMKNDSYRHDYVDFIEDMVSSGYASMVPVEHIRASEGKCWYLPHHGVYNPNKPGKIRVVFDCSATFSGTSLNSNLLPGPDLINSLCGVLIRFRMHPIAFMGDIEKMFHQVRVPEGQRSLLRFFWWPKGNFDAPIREYHMNVHLFGAVSSPSVVNFALKRIALDPEIPQEAAQTILHNFYVDDCLRSVESTDEAILILQQLRDACLKRGFHLHKFISNSIEVMDSIPKEEQCKEVRERDLRQDPLPAGRALGVKWDVRADTLGFSFRVGESPPTRRGILSVISSIYDPLGFIAPFLLEGKAILQETCKQKDVGWDDVIPSAIMQRWKCWIAQLPLLGDFAIARCFRMHNVKSTSE